MALEKLKFQTNSALKFYRSNKSLFSSILIMTVPEKQTRKVPSRTNLWY